MDKDDVKRKFILAIELALKTKCTYAKKSNLLLNLISLNIDLGRNDRIYKIMKSYFFFHLKAVKHSAHGYDKVNLAKLNDLIDLLPLSQRVSFVDYCITIVKLNHTEETFDWLLNKRHECRIKFLWNEKRVCARMLSILLLASFNIRNLILAIIITFVAISLVLVPTPYEKLAVFEISYHNYTTNQFFNHIANMLTLFLDIDNDLKVDGTGFISVVILVLAKLAYILLIVNFIYLRLIDKLSVK
ncbi:hypothetical protein [Sphingobacterium sp. BIGb0116]|uniref:hypothetical protein n=1 Tax=Sphingobacterium sp. BIGb0116 TaxID=2940619 RepID=UPI002169C103|nr:hypothetical protein [Sphingobacterium sp. BIGb0116]MCS4163790.1 hypothetical protein [Sphingobacterium sp. BIGb0116]